MSGEKSRGNFPVGAKASKELERNLWGKKKKKKKTKKKVKKK